MSISSNIKQLQASIPEGVTLVAVSKFHPVEALQEAYAAGQRVFGENKAQELLLKQEVMPKDIQWHFIGHLQSNKVKTIAPFIHTIHSIDSAKLLQEVDIRLPGLTAPYAFYYRFTSHGKILNSDLALKSASNYWKVALLPTVSM